MGIDPTGNHGLIAEYSLDATFDTGSGYYQIDANPQPLGSVMGPGMAAPNGDVAYRVTNNDTVAHIVQVTIFYQPLEA